MVLSCPVRVLFPVSENNKLALRFGLRAHDSVQLASAQRVHRQLSSNLTFCGFDRQLNSAAAALAINVLSE